MQIISKALILSKEEYFMKHLLIISPFIPVPLTEKEIEFLATALMVEEKLGEFTFETTGRREIRRLMNISHGGLGNYLRELKLKGYLLEDDRNVISILDILKPESHWQGYQFKLEIKEDGL